MRRGEIYLVDLEPAVGSEANKRRPVILVTNDGANERASRLNRGIVTVVPLTSNTERIHDFQVLLPAKATGLVRDSKAQAEQVRSISVERFGPRIGSVPHRLMVALDDALRLQLGL